MEERYGAHTWMWRSCCLDKVADAFQMREYEGSKIMVSKYNWCMTRDVGTITITGKKGSMIRKGGLMHSQFYGMGKLQFDANKHFPWDDGDDTMAILALDNHYRDALRSTMGAKTIDLSECRRSYNHCGRRYVIGTRTNDDQSWGGREEHRMSLTLTQAVNSELHCRGNPELRRKETRTQFYVHPTKIINMFSEVVALPIASWYQQTLGMAPEGMLGMDHQKLAILQCLLLKNSYWCSPLSQISLLWKGTVEDNKVGLGLKEVIEKYGFGWLPKRMFNWEANNFIADVAKQFPFPIRTLERRFNKRKGEWHITKEILQEMDQVTGRLDSLKDEDRMFLMNWIPTRVMRQYHDDVWERLYRSPYLFKSKEHDLEHRQEQDEEAGPRKKRKLTIKTAKVIKKTWDEPPALTYASVKAELEENPHPVGLGKSYRNREDFFKLIFGITEADWGTKGIPPYLQAVKYLKAKLSAADYESMMQRLRRLFDRTCHCVPNISKEKWLAGCGSKSAKSNFKPGWVAFDENGDRIDCSSYKAKYALQKGSSWLETRSIHDDPYWNISLEDALGD